jgi:hypothetical protein
MNTMNWMTLALGGILAIVLAGGPSTALAADDDDIVLLYPEHNPLTQIAFADGSLAAACWVETDLCGNADDGARYLTPLLRLVTKGPWGAATLSVLWVPVDPCADEDDIVFLRPEHNPLQSGKFKGDVTSCWDIADPAGDDDDIVYLVPEHNPYTQVDTGGDGDGIKDYWDPDDDN